MITIGLTGGIASGKSTVSRILHSAGATIIDADAIARDVVQQNQPAYERIVQHFGSRILDAAGDINRADLAGIIFKDRDAQQILNRIVHPYVIDEIERRLIDLDRKRPDAIVVLDVPLLFEAGMTEGLAEIIVVYVPEAVQLKRLIQRDRISLAAARQRIRSQMPIDKKRRLASIIIDNSGDPETTQLQTLAVFEEIKRKYRQIDNP